MTLPSAGAPASLSKEWNFYDYDREAKLTPIKTLRLNSPNDDDVLLDFLHDFVDRTAKMTPPTGDEQWTEGLVQPFLDLAASYEASGEYEVKRDLWRGVLAGAFIESWRETAERDLFARQHDAGGHRPSRGRNLAPGRSAGPRRGYPPRQTLRRLLPPG